MEEEIRKTGVAIIGDAPWGTHLCQFYQTKEDLIDILVPYFKAGLQNNEFCMWVTSDPLAEKEAKKVMRKAVLDFDQYLKRGQIEIVPHDQWYLKDGTFNLQRVLDAWIDKLNQALSKGYDGIRVSGNTAWLEKRDWRNFTDYEEEINNVIGKHRMLAICAYALDKCGASEVIDVVHNHQSALIKREGKWERIESSERKRAEEALKKERATLNSIINLNPYSIAIYDAEGHYVRGNQAFLDLFKAPPPPDYSLFADPILEMSGYSEEVLRLKKGEVVKLPEIWYNPHAIKPEIPDNPVLVRGLGFPILDKDGDVEYVVAMHEDFTERKKAEEAMRESEKKFRALAEQSPNMIFINKIGRVLFANKKCEEIMGYKRDEFYSQDFNFLILIAPEYVELVQSKFAKHMKGEELEPYEYALITKDGKRIEAIITTKLIDYGGERAILGIVTDITERKQAEEALRKSEERYRHIVETANEGIWVLDADHMTVFTNSKMAEMLGYTVGEMIGKPLFAFADDEWHAISEITLMKPHCKRVAERHDFKFRRKDGTELWAIVSTKPLLDKEERYVGCLGMVTDITERKKAEEETRSKIRHIATVHETAQVAIDAEHPQELARSILRSLSNVMPVDAFSFVICNPATNELVSVLQADIIDGKFKVWEKNGAYPLENNPMLSIFQSGKPIIELRKPDEGTASKFVPFGDTSRRSASLMFAPMCYKEETKGIVTVQSYTYNAYSRADLELFADVANVVGVALSRLTAEENLRKSEEIYRKAISFAQGVPYQRDYRLSAFTFVGEGITELTGYSLEEFNAGVFYKIAQEKILRGELAGVEFKEAIQRTQAGQVNKWQADYRILKRDGQTRWIADSSVQLKDTQGKVTGSLGILQDITERKRAEEELKHVHQIYRDVIENAQGVPYRLNHEDGTYEFFGKGCEKLIGIPSDEVTQKRFGELVKNIIVTDLEAPSDPFEYAKVFQRGEVKRYRTDIKIVTPRGEEKWLSDCSLPIFDKKTGQVIASLGILQDITERKRAEEALRESEIRLKEAQRIGGIGYWEFDVESKQITWSEQVYRLFERDPAKGPPTYEENMAYYYPNDSKKLQEQVRRAIEFGEEFDTDYRLKLPSGKSVYHRGLIRTVKDENGSVIKLYGTTQDISERRQAEEALKTQAHVLQSMVEGVNVSDENGIIFFTNPAFDAVFGYERGELIGKHVSILNADSPEENDGIVREVIEQLQTKGAFFGEFNNVKKDGTLFTTYARISTLEISGEHYWVSVQEDITERKRAEEALRTSEEQLRQSQKMEAIGRLAGGVAHDFNNLLTAITGYTELLLNRVSDQDPLRKDIEEIYKAAEAAASLTRQLLVLSRRQVLQPMALDLNAVVTDLEKMLRHLIGEDIDMVTILEANLDRVKADRGQIKQVIMNLAVNARDAIPMPESGKLTIKTENMTLDEDYCTLVPEARPGKFVCLSVTDTGSGMDKEIIPHIFDPFFSTKKGEKGTGLGLSVVYGIVEQHEGWINVYSEPGQGSTFKVYLPTFSIKQKDQIKKTVSLPKLQGRGERILLVEDEQRVREFTTRVLRENGYVVFDAGNAKEALDIFEREKGNFHLVFSDIVLPDKSGSLLAEQLLSRKPELSVLLCSGYTDQRSQWPLMRERGFRFLQKPYSLADLLQAIRAAIRPKKRKSEAH